MLMLIILVLKRQRTGGSQFKASPVKQFMRPHLEKTHHKKGLVEWVKVYALSSNPSTTRGKERKKERMQRIRIPLII
jgi:hypothetical protein